MGIYLWPYKAGSKSAKALAVELGARRLRSHNSNFIPRPNKVVINWGNGGDIPFDSNKLQRLLNKPVYVNRASNKLLFFKHLRENALGTLLPPHAFNIDDASVLLSNMKYPKVFCRTLLRGHSGEGIVIATTPEELVPARLYTANLGWRHEYRVHVALGNVIDYQKKCRLTDENLQERGITLNKDVRNLSNGWIYAREGKILPENARLASIEVINAMGLDFGAVDVCVLKNGIVHVLEVNTACGLEGQTVTAYAEALREVA